MILVMPETMSIERRKLMQVFGAEIMLTPGSLGMQGSIDKARELAEASPDFFLPMQFDNSANPSMHERTTAKEVLEQMRDNLDAFVCSVGTGGTITGVGNILKQAYKDILVIAAEPEDSPVLSGGFRE